jgi:hypothetical protein
VNVEREEVREERMAELRKGSMSVEREKEGKTFDRPNRVIGMVSKYDWLNVIEKGGK